MLSGWLWFCLAVATVMAFLGMVAGAFADSSRGETRREHQQQSGLAFGCGMLLFLTVIVLLFWLRP